MDKILLRVPENESLADKYFILEVNHLFPAHLLVDKKNAIRLAREILKLAGANKTRKSKREASTNA